MESNYYNVLSETIRGERICDQHSCEAAVVMSERLERLKAIGGKFANIELSGAVRNLLANDCKVAV
ncbi:MAG: hypothetical protein H8D47_00420 [Planctomycetes bacterium]|nr:hypothetical protein [Planctomycetota bacterium]